MKILHLIRALNDYRACETARRQEGMGHEVSIILIQDAVLERETLPGRVLALKEDVLARTEVSQYPTVDYDDLVRMLFDHDKVIVW